LKNKLIFIAFVLMNLGALFVLATPPNNPLDKCIQTNCETDGTGCLASNPGGDPGHPDLPHPHDPNTVY